MKRLLSAAFLIGLCVPAHAATGQALVIGIGQYAGQSTLPSCSRSAHAVSARLRQLGFTVDEAVDASAATLRETLAAFAGHATSAGTSPVAYVCAEADPLDQRVFLLPADVDLQQPLHPETQGIVVKALFNAFTATNGTVIAEFGLGSGKPGAVAEAVRAMLPSGVHLALAVGDGRQTGVLGIRLADAATPLEQGWFGLATALQRQHDPSGSTVTTFVPFPVPPAPLAPPAPPPPPPVLPAPEPRPVPHHARPPVVSRPHKPAAAQRASDKVRRLQTALARRGFYQGTPDGIADAWMVNAVRQYQTSLGDQTTGRLTQAEIIKLLNDW